MERFSEDQRAEENGQSSFQATPRNHSERSGARRVVLGVCRRECSSPVFTRAYRFPCVNTRAFRSPSVDTYSHAYA